MIIVTGGAGFVGSHVVRALNNQGRHDIVVVDHLKNGHKFRNLVGCHIQDYFDRADFLTLLKEQKLPAIEAIIHQGACTTTTEWDGQYMMANNYEYSKSLLHFAQGQHIPLIYASSASVYGTNRNFREHPDNENPLNVYAYSKWLFDEYVRKLLPKSVSQVVGLRYFNVYGPHEAHKGGMASVMYHFNRQVMEDGVIRLFGEYDGFEAGRQLRDFIYVEDVAKTVLWFLEQPKLSGIFNLGSGRHATFYEVAELVRGWHGDGEIEYIPFPESLMGAYQSYTQADLHQLRHVGFDEDFTPLKEGVTAYLDWLNR